MTKQQKRYDQLVLAGAEASAKQLAAARGDMMRTKVPQEAPGGLFAERFDDTPDMFGISEAASAMAATAEFRKGGNAYRAGKALTNNPFACPGTAWERWHYGWMAAEEAELEERS